MDRTASAWNPVPAIVGDRLARRALLVLVALDFAFIVLHGVRGLLGGVDGPLPDYRLRIDIDGGFAEIFNYLKLAAITVLCLAVWRRGRHAAPLLWGLVFLFALADDALSLHEDIGNMLVAPLGLPAVLGLRPNDLGELIVWAAPGVLLLVPLAYVTWRTPPKARRFSQRLVVLLAALVFFAVVVDMVHIMVVHWSRYVNGMLSLIEDGGEMVVVSAVCAYLVAAYRAPPAGDPPGR